ncbi:hypothetical protein Tco_0497553 [Tanacetum coccineum]
MNAVSLNEGMQIAFRPIVSENGIVNLVQIAMIGKGLLDGEEGKMALPVQNINHSAFRSMFEKEKLSDNNFNDNNFNDWFARLKLVLRVEKKIHVIEQPLPPPSPEMVLNLK